MHYILITIYQMEITRNYSRKLQLLRLETTEFLCGTEVKTQRFHCRGLGQWWPAAGSGALSAAVHHGTF